jgi:hypothetical protein
LLLRIRLNADIDLDIPAGFESTQRYCATLGHKVRPKSELKSLKNIDSSNCTNVGRTIIYICKFEAPWEKSIFNHVNNNVWDSGLYIMRPTTSYYLSLIGAASEKSALKSDASLTHNLHFKLKTSM